MVYRVTKERYDSLLRALQTKSLIVPTYSKQAKNKLWNKLNYKLRSICISELLISPKLHNLINNTKTLNIFKEFNNSIESENSTFFSYPLISPTHKLPTCLFTYLVVFN